MRSEQPRERSARLVRALLLASAAIVAAGLALLVPAAPAAAHSYAATVFADVTEPEPGLVRTVLEVEYVLLATDGARAMEDADFEADAYADVQASGRDPEKLTTEVLERHSDSVLGYVLPRYSISVEGDAPAGTSAPVDACPNTLAEPFAITIRDGVPHAKLVIDSDCRSEVGAAAPVYRIGTELFPGTAPGGKTTTIVSYDLRSGSGVANLDTDTSPTVTTTQDWGSRMGEFLVLGSEHLLFGPDHLLFLLALIVGARRLRDIVVVATAFTVAHSMTFIAAALGFVSVPPAIVEPIIAFSIAAVALWSVWVSRRGRGGLGGMLPWNRATPLDVDLLGSGGRSGLASGAGSGSGAGTRQGSGGASAASQGGGLALRERTVVTPLPAVLAPPRGFSREDWVRVAVVFVFGLVHGVGFAGALGIEEPFSWGLLGALLVFNVGIELTQLVLIAIAFPLIVLVRRRVPGVPLWIELAVAAVGLFWFFERLFAVG
ncbi:HupE/UreJ family protein [Agromyces endophyticus]|uniref:HupE/UreJ family protein n=1 Tax=Agromyces sp. H17E-10 TaxID=2932244 RepID=UPI001FD39946|nr:HupE/UreJ family protein [Agromyces sp. H17E-10]UOQ90732.1 HupE/UreJ family protein [Agromyces sp. H17E-10]